MKIVIDSNIIFSALISGKEIYVDIFRINDVFIPDIVLLELKKYETRLIKKTRLKQNEFRMFVQTLFEEITIIPKFAISPENWQKAYEICNKIDEKDTPFVALSFELKIPLCSNDKILCKGLKRKGFDNFVTFENLMKIIDQ